METTCREWHGPARIMRGYAVVRKSDLPVELRDTVRNGAHLAHRWTWEQLRGPIPAGMFVCHRCDNTACVNIDHLFLGTHKENMADMVRKGRQASGVSPVCRKGHQKKLYGGRYRCVECHAASRLRNRLLA
jgi:hypothetical protein